MRLVPRPGAMTGVFLCFCLAVGTALSDDTLSHRDDLSAKDRVKAAKVLQPPADFEAAEAFEIMQGGAGTSRKRINRDAYSHSNANLTFEEQATFKVGNGLFKKLWASSPSSTQASDGLGPLYNARSCQGCHLKDGRGRPPRVGEDAVSMFLRLSIPPQSEAQRQALADKDILLVPEPTYGGQFQTFAVPGLPGEGRFDIDVEEIEVPLDGGEKAVLQKPVYRIRDLGYGDMHPDTMISARAAPPMIGLGLVQAIHPGDIEALADPDDIDSDGISGKVSRVRVMDLVTFYSENLAVPMRRDVDDPAVLKGKQVFYQSGCPACHQPKFVTSRKAENPAHRFQLIWPYSDFLLHDMGEALADNRPVGDASGQEWRTPPLWGIGLTETVNNHTRFLHDGRARNLLEAVLWHDGEARQARDAVVALPPADRQSLIRFLESL